MKKYTKKKKTAITIAFMGILGLCAVMGMSQKEYKSTYASVEPSTQAVVYDDEEQTISFDIDELNNYTFNNLADYLNDNYETINSELSFTGIIYNDDFHTFDEYIETDILSYNYDEFYIILDLDLDTPNVFKRYSDIGGTITYTDFSYSATWDLSQLHQNVYLSIKTEIELDIQANQPTSQGDSIISAITSGLGLAPDVANEFLKGFTAIFWDSTNSSLTRVSNFMLVMLGIAMVMAIIKLSLSLIRSNTGA